MKRSRKAQVLDSGRRVPEVAGKVAKRHGVGRDRMRARHSFDEPAFHAEGHLLLELLVGCDRVARDAEHRNAGVDELGVEIAELPTLVGASGRVVARIEVEDEGVALERRKLETLVAGS